VITFVGRRLAWSAVVLFAVGTTAFFLTFIAPADPARSIAGRNASAEAVEAIRAALGLDRPAYEQLASYWAGLLTLDFGTSHKLGGLPVLGLILEKLPATIELAVAGLLVAVAIGIPLGVASARRPGRRADRLGALLGSLLVSVPSFLLGLLLLYFFAYRLRIDFGIELFPLDNSSWSPLDLTALILPAIALGIGGAAFYLRITRTTMLDEMHHGYVRTARSKGAPERQVVWRHAFRNAMPPIITQAGLDLGFFLGGVVLVEAVFSWPGIGQQAVKAITSEDLPMMMGTLLFATLCIVLVNLVVDVIYAYLDPRVTHWHRQS
jgi:peptide/nickel transport system permease protein